MHVHVRAHTRTPVPRFAAPPGGASGPGFGRCNGKPPAWCGKPSPGEGVRCVRLGRCPGMPGSQLRELHGTRRLQKAEARFGLPPAPGATPRKAPAMTT